MIAESTSLIEARHDMELVTRTIAGDELAFEEITHRYRSRLYATAFRLSNSATDAEEIVQDAFIRAHRSLANFRGESSFSTWIYRIVFNLARNRYHYWNRRRRNQTIALEAPLSEDGVATVADTIHCPSSSPVSDAATAEFVEAISSCMQALPKSHREILHLCAVQGRSYEEIGAELRINEGTVKSRIARAREALRKLLQDRVPDFGRDTDPGSFFVLTRATQVFALTPR